MADQAGSTRSDCASGPSSLCASSGDTTAECLLPYRPARSASHARAQRRCAVCRLGSPPPRLAPPAPERAPAIPARRAAAFPAGWRFAPGTRGDVRRAQHDRQQRAAGERRGRRDHRRAATRWTRRWRSASRWPSRYPAAGNIGGGGFMVDPHGRRPRRGDRLSRGRAARRARATCTSTRTASSPNESVVGHRASGVPGAVAGMAEALREVRHDVAGAR